MLCVRRACECVVPAFVVCCVLCAVAVPSTVGVTTVLPAAGVRRSKRRRWEPLEWWEGTRIVYDENGAKRAEKVGVLTPVLTAAEQRVRAVGAK